MSYIDSSIASSYQYNIDGIRIARVENGQAVNYLVDQNRDYAQVITETTATNVIDYTYGDDLLSQSQQGQTFTYHYDGLGSTRLLTDELGNNTDSYDYEAFGETLNKTGTTENSYLYTGEQFDAGLDNYYLRARYYDQGVGRFTQQDEWQGKLCTPITLNKYVYANADGVNGIDPSGFMTILSQSAATAIQSTLRAGGSASFRIVLRKSGCFAIEQVAEGVLTEGVYAFIEDLGRNNGKIYVGRTNDYVRRLNQHLGKKIKTVERAVVRFGIDIPVNLTPKITKIAEQLIIDLMGGKDKLGNKVNGVSENPRSKASKRLRKLLNKAKLCK